MGSLEFWALVVLVAVAVQISYRLKLGNDQRYELLAELRQYQVRKDEATPLYPEAAGRRFG